MLIFNLYYIWIYLLNIIYINNILSIKSPSYNLTLSKINSDFRIKYLVAISAGDSALSILRILLTKSDNQQYNIFLDNNRTKIMKFEEVTNLNTDILTDISAEKLKISHKLLINAYQDIKTYVIESVNGGIVLSQDPILKLDILYISFKSEVDAYLTNSKRLSVSSIIFITVICIILFFLILTIILLCYCFYKFRK